MLINQTALALISAAGEHSEGGINPWVVGGGVFAILLLLMIGLVAFGGGREHS